MYYFCCQCSACARQRTDERKSYCEHCGAATMADCEALVPGAPSADLTWALAELFRPEENADAWG